MPTYRCMYIMHCIMYVHEVHTCQYSRSLSGQPFPSYDVWSMYVVVGWGERDFFLEETCTQ